MEVWKEVYGFDILYEVSNLGNVRTKYVKNRGYTSEYHECIPLDNGNGYLRFNWKSNRKSHTVYVHRLVALYFLENPNGYLEINHKDENKNNNSADNLEWCDRVYNSNYGTRNIRSAKKNKIKIRCNETGIIYDSVKAAAEDMNVRNTAISNCLNNRSKSSCGYTWSYV